jgi:hypothetical protein
VVRLLRRRRWPRGDWLALAEAFAVLASVRLALATMSYKRV